MPRSLPGFGKPFPGLNSTLKYEGYEYEGFSDQSLVTLPDWLFGRTLLVISERKDLSEMKEGRLVRAAGWHWWGRLPSVLSADVICKAKMDALP